MNKYTTYATLLPILAVEWVALGVLGLCSILLVYGFGFSVVGVGAYAQGLPLMIAAALVLRFKGWGRIALVSEYLGAAALTAGILMIFNYASCALAFPLQDAFLGATDQALGFNWLAGFNFVDTHVLVKAVLATAYRSYKFQMIFIALYFAARSDLHRLREVFWLTLVGAVLTCAIGALVPAMGAFRANHLEIADYLPVMAGLRSGVLHSVTIVDGVGVISFPSFHTVMALVNTYAVRRTSAFWVMLVLNVLMLLSTPFFGGHYLSDMIAGAAVAICVAFLVRVPLKWRIFVPGSMPQMVPNMP